MYNVTQQAAKFKACPNRMGAEELDHSAKSASSGEPSEHPGSPLALLKHAYDAVQEEPRVVAGSATACIITLDSSKGVLRSANVGDSGFIILRHGANSAGSSPGSSPSSEKETSHRLTSDTKLQPAHQPLSSRSAHRPQEGIFFASTPLQLGFNTPLQLAKLPASMVQEGSIANKPEDAALWECHLRDGDLVIMATDGVWDNVHNAEIVQLTRFIKEKHHASWVSEHEGAPSKMSASRAEKENGAKDWLAEERSFVQVLAHNLIEYTRMCQFSQTKRSPFEREAERYGIHYPGGKVDDAAVVIALVVER
jgi:protein phosphatase PTC7